MQLDIQQTIALLSHTPHALDALLRGLSDEWLLANEGDSTWNIFNVVAHLIHGERVNWMARAHWILEVGEAEAFPLFDREGDARPDEKQTIEPLLDEFQSVRSKSLEDLRALNLGPKELARCGQHPTFGRVTLSQLLATWTVHDMTHIHQISRILAHQYREAVGPWVKFLGVLHCEGHST